MPVSSQSLTRTTVATDHTWSLEGKHRLPLWGIHRRRHHSPSIFLKRTVAAQLHVLAVLFAIVGGCFLVPRAMAFGVANGISAIIFLIVGTCLFATSSTYHFLHDGFAIRRRVAQVLERWDRSFIFLFIASTYTPVLLRIVEGPWAKILLVWIWGWAAMGLGMTNWPRLFPRWVQHRAVYTLVCVFMGWTFLIRGEAILTALTSEQMNYLLSGGVAYSLGAMVYIFKRPNIFPNIFGYHELWHASVLMGFVSHFMLIWSLY